jgi:paraquat-inducible protein B
VTTETRFWNVSGVNITLDADGFRVRTESLAALLAGGIAFDVPDFAPRGSTAAPANTEFALYRYRAVAMKEPTLLERRFVLYFNESVRGLSVGAPVTLFGMQVGEVTEVGLTFNARTGTFRPRVVITFLPDRVIADLPTGQRTRAGKSLAELPPEERTQLLRRVVEDQGLRGQLRTGSYLTGELYVAFEYFPDAPKVKVDWAKDPLELPVVPGSLASIEAKLGNILTKIDKLPLDAIGGDLRKALGTLDQTLKDANKLVNSVDTQWVPEGTKTLEDLRKAIGDANTAVKNADATLFSKDSATPQDLRDTMQEITRAARSIRVLMDYLERHPDALIRGKTETK